MGTGLGAVLSALAHRMAGLRRQAIGAGTVNVLPWETDVIPANGWDWRPAPVFQSYAAFTPALDRLDAEHYASASAADFVLLNFPAIDRRHPFLETPVSWRA